VRPQRPGRRRSALLTALLTVGLFAPSSALAAEPAGASPGRPAVLGDLEVRHHAAAVSTSSDPAVCDPVLSRTRGGARALAELGDRLPEVARRHQRRPAELRSQLRADETLHVGPCGDLFYVDPAPAVADEHDDHGSHGHDDPHASHGHDLAATSTSASGDTVVRATSDDLPAPLAQTFQLQSRPASPRTIYLDFDGHVLSGTPWNTVPSVMTDPLTMSPFSLDGAPGFSDLERAFIQRVWQRVAEDFAPFDVNVTTQDLGAAALERTDAADTTFGTRAIVTDHDPSTSGLCGGCAGLGLVATFDRVGGGQSARSALIFASVVLDEPQIVADVVSHEVGHNLALAHHDDVASGGFGYSYGQGLWAPLMGSSILPLSTWSVGDYAGATTVQDDVAVIDARGAPLLSDDHGDTAATATVLAAAGGVTTTGLVERRVDEDWFRFEAAGPTTIVAAPAPQGPNLDLELQLYAADGSTVLGTDDPGSDWPYLGSPPWTWFGAAPVTGLDARLERDLAPGTYHVRVRGVGAGDPRQTGYSDYGSLGRYTLGISPDGVSPPPPVDPPVVTITSGPPAITRDATVSIGFASDRAGTAFECRVDGGAWQSCASPRGVTVGTDGPHTFAVRGTAAGATSAPVGRSWTLDRVAPGLGLTGTPAQGTTTTGRTATFSWTPDEPLRAATRCRLLVDGSAVFGWSDCGNEFGGGISFGSLPAGALRFELRGTDLAGNTATVARAWTITGGTTPPPPPPSSFTDVPANHTHARAIAILASRDVTGGCTRDGRTYCPDQPVTREQMATFLARALKLPAGSSSPPFTDVAAGGTHAANIDAVRRANITQGCTRDGRSFCPRDSVARDQMASFLQRARGYPIVSTSPPFRDVPAGSTHAGAIDALVRNEVTQGCSTPGSFCPKGAVTRGQMATFIARAMRWM
jgi:hypothetical protein